MSPLLSSTLTGRCLFTVCFLLHLVVTQENPAMLDEPTRTHELVWVDGPTGRLRVSDGGRGEPAVVFLHSLGGRHTQWTPQLSHLRRTRRAVAMDLRGQGESEGASDGDYSLAALAVDLHSTVEHLDLGRVIVVGHSFGAGVGLVYAGAHPDRVAGLLLVDPIGEQRRASAELEAFVSRLRSDAYAAAIGEYWASILTGADESVREAVLSDLHAASPAAVIGGLEATLELDPRAAMSRYGGPALVVRTPLNDFPYSLHRVLEGIPTEVVEGTSHWLQMDRPRAFNALMDGFIERVEGR